MTGADAAGPSGNHAQIDNDNDNEAFLDNVPDIIVLTSRGEVEEPELPADASQLDSITAPATPVANQVFGSMAGTIFSPDPNQQQQAMLNQRSIQRMSAASALADYTIVPNIPVVGDRSSHLSATGQPSNFAQSISNIGPAQPGNNFVGRIHQASNNRDMVVPAVNADAMLGNHLPAMVSPAPTSDPQPVDDPPAPAPSQRETLLRNNAPAGTVDDVSSFWREGVEAMPRPNPNDNPNYKEDRSPKLLSTSTTAGRPQKSVAPSPKWYNALPETSMRHAKLKVGQLFGVLTLLPIINLLGHLASHASGEIMPLYDSTHPLQAVSITVSRLGGDVPVEWLELLGQYMKIFAVLGLIAVEQGTMERNLHLQAVMVMHMSGADRCIELITEHIKVWLDVWTHEKFQIKVVRMDRSRGHALFYMMGYCLKDRPYAHFKYIVLNLTREMLRAGISAYNGVSTAAASINNTNTSLARNNWFNKVMKFICTKLKGLNPAPCPMRAVTWMLCSADYTIHTDWVEKKFGSWVEVSYLANAALLLERPIEATRAMVIHLISGRPAGIAYFMDNAHRDYAEDRLHLSNDFMRFAVNNGEDDEYANVTLQEAIARATDPAELDNTPVNSDDEEDPNENTSNLPPSQRPLPVAIHEMYLRDRYIQGGAYEYMQSRGYRESDTVRYTDAAATARRRQQRQATREQRASHRVDLAGRFAAEAGPSNSSAAPNSSAATPGDAPSSHDDTNLFDLQAFMNAAHRS